MKIAYIALWIFVFSLPWQGTVVIPGVGVISRLLGIIAIALAGIMVLISGQVRRLHLLHLAAILFVVLAGVHLLVFYPQEKLPAKFWTYVQLLLMIWMIWQLARSRWQQVGLMTAYVLGGHIAAIGTIMVYLQRGQALRRFSTGGVDPNDLAMMLALGLPMAWYLGMVYRQPLLRWLCRAYLPVGIVALGLTGSRGGMIAAITALMVVPLTLTKLSPAKLVGAIAILILSGWLAVTYTPDTIVQRLSTTQTEVQGGRMGGRLKLWQAGLKVYVNRPIFGWGTSSFKPAVTPILGPMAQVAHNSFLSVLVEQGLVGLVLYLIMFAAVFREVLTLPPLEKRFALVLMATVVVAMLPLTWEDHKSVWFILATLLGFAKAVSLAYGPVRQVWAGPAAPLGGWRPAGARPAPQTTRRQNMPNPLGHDA